MRSEIEGQGRGSPYIIFIVGHGGGIGCERRVRQAKALQSSVGGRCAELLRETVYVSRRSGCGGVGADVWRGRVLKQVRVVVVAWRSKVKGHLSMHVHQLASNETRLNERCRLLIRPLLAAPMPGPGAWRSQFFRLHVVLKETGPGIHLGDYIEAGARRTPP